jgi:hypothetical protein
VARAEQQQNAATDAAADATLAADEASDAALEPAADAPVSPTQLRAARLARLEQSDASG